jgi:hypothetical protein
LVDILGTGDRCVHYPCSVLSTLAQAEELLLLVDRLEEYEIVRLSDDDFSETPMFGYDVGYWGGGTYSILCDSVIWPMWHGPNPEAFDHLLQYVEPLNAHMLFPDHASANRFRSFYLTQPWAETEAAAGDFSVIRVDEVERSQDALRRSSSIRLLQSAFRIDSTRGWPRTGARSGARAI